MWFVEPTQNIVGRITPYGAITEFVLDLPPLPSTAEHPMQHLGNSAAGPDGALWFIESYLDTLGRITPTGVVTHHPLHSLLLDAPGSVELRAGPDGALWYATVVYLYRFQP
jgi:virginiamycin B lyase